MSDKIQIKLTVRQVRDGLKYNGDIEFDGTRFFYFLDFTTHVELMGELLKPEESDSAIKRLCKLTLKKLDDAPDTITLPENIWQLFVYILMPTAVDFYYQEQTRDFNNGLGRMLHGNGLLAASLPGVTASISFETSCQIERNPALVEFLSQHAA